MSDLIAIAYPDTQRADEVMLALKRLQKEHLIDLADVAAVTRDREGNVKLTQLVNLTAAGAAMGGFWGMLLGMLLMNPLLGLAVGAGAGALSGRFSDAGVNDQFMKELGQQLKPGTSAVFTLVRKSSPEKVLAEIAPFGGTVLRSSLSSEAEARLQEALSSGAAATTPADVRPPAPGGARPGAPASPPPAPPA